MPQTDPIQGFTGLPVWLDPYAIPDTLAALYNFLLARSNMVFATATARDAALPSPSAGMMCITGSGAGAVLWIYTTAWQQVWSTPDPWHSLTPASGYKNGDKSLQYRYEGRSVRIRGQVAPNSGSFGTSGYSTIANIPTPSGGVYHSCVVVGAGTTLVRVNVTASGDLQVLPAASSSYVNVDFTYPIG